MNSVKCARCGLVNWVGTECRRCGVALAFIEKVSAAPPVERAPWQDEHRAGSRGVNICTFCGTEFEGFFCTLCRKHVKPAALAPHVTERSKVWALVTSWKLHVALVALLAAASVAVVIIVRTHGDGSEEATEYQAGLIQASAQFTTPPAVTFVERSAEPAAGVEVLEALGLVRCRTEAMTLRRTASGEEVWSEDAMMIEEPKGAAVVLRHDITTTELTGNGIVESAAWQTYKAWEPSLGPWRESKGWRVPLGEREFVRVRRSYPKSGGALDVTAVEFTWRWKPNTLGRRFDASRDEFKTLPSTAQQNAMRLAFNDSTKLHEATATLRFDGAFWSVQEIDFIGDK